MSGTGWRKRNLGIVAFDRQHFTRTLQQIGRGITSAGLGFRRWWRFDLPVNADQASLRASAMAESQMWSRLEVSLSLQRDVHPVGHLSGGHRLFVNHLRSISIASAIQLRLPGVLLVLLLGLLTHNGGACGQVKRRPCSAWPRPLTAQVAVAVVLFQAGISTNWQEMRSVARPGLRLALVGLTHHRLVVDGGAAETSV